MLKWLALMIVTTVLCFGTDGTHSNQTPSDKAKSGRPIVEERKPSAEGEVEDSLTASDKEELKKLIEELDTVSQSQNRTIGEQRSEETTIPNL